MLYGAPRQAIHLATDLRSSAREAVEGERTLSAATSAAVERRPAALVVTRRPLLAALRQHVTRRIAAQAGVR